MEFKAKNYIKDESLPFYKTWSNSELLCWSSLSVAMISILILMGNQKYLHNNEIIENVFKNISYIFLGVLLISIVMRFGEYEKLNGQLDGEISLEETGIQINEDLYLFSEIRDLDFSYRNKYGSITGKSNGAFLSQGLNNYISFYHNEKLIKTYFQLYSTSQYDAIQKDLFYYVINEIFPFEKKNLDFIDKQFHHYTLYKEFIEKMKREGKLT